MPSSLLCLPPKLLVAVVLNLPDLRDILRCSQTCKHLNSLVCKDDRIQYRIELAVAGMQDGPSSPLPTADRLAILRERQAAWDTLTWRERHEQSMGAGSTWELYGGVLAQTEGKRSLSLRRLPSVIRGIPDKQWAIEDVGFDIRDFGMDPTQDLLVAIEHKIIDQDRALDCCIHLCSLATGAVHPAAVKGAALQHRLAPGRHSYTIQTSSDLLGILTESPDDDTDADLLIWNWKTGTRLLHVIASKLSSFAFLTSRHVLITALRTDEPGEQTLFVNGLSDPHLLVIDLETAPNHPVRFTDLDYLCSFHYPVFSSTFTPITIQLRSDPSPDWTPHPSLRMPFSVSRKDRLFVVTIWVLEVHIPIGLLSLVPASTLLGKIEGMQPGETRRKFTWDKWGPSGSRLLLAPSTHTSVWVCYVYGMTFAVAYRQGSQKVIVTYDFNQMEVRRRAAAAKYNLDVVGENACGGDAALNANGVVCAIEGGERAPVKSRETLVTEATKLIHARIFTTPVQTALPYRMKRTQLFGVEGEGHFAATMISEDSLIMVLNQPNVRKYLIFTF